MSEHGNPKGSTITVYVDGPTRAKADALAAACGLSRSRLLAELVRRAEVEPLQLRIGAGS